MDQQLLRKLKTQCTGLCYCACFLGTCLCKRNALNCSINAGAIEAIGMRISSKVMYDSIQILLLRLGVN